MFRRIKDFFSPITMVIIMARGDEAADVIRKVLVSDDNLRNIAETSEVKTDFLGFDRWTTTFIIQQRLGLIKQGVLGIKIGYSIAKIGGQINQMYGFGKTCFLDVGTIFGFSKDEP